MVWQTSWRRRGCAVSSWSPTPPHTDLRADLSRTATLLLPVCKEQSHYRSTPPCHLSSDPLPSKQRCCGAFFPLHLWITNIANNELIHQTSLSGPQADICKYSVTWLVFERAEHSPHPISCPPNLKTKTYFCPLYISPFLFFFCMDISATWKHRQGATVFDGRTTSLFPFGYKVEIDQITFD